MRKIAKLEMAKTSSKALNEWFMGKQGSYEQKELADRTGVARQTLHRYKKSMLEGDGSKLEDLFTFTTLNIIIDYYNEMRNKEFKDEREKNRAIDDQLKIVNKIRKSQGLEPFSREEFVKTNELE